MAKSASLILSHFFEMRSTRTSGNISIWRSSNSFALNMAIYYGAITSCVSPLPACMMEAYEHERAGMVENLILESLVPKRWNCHGGQRTDWLFRCNSNKKTFQVNNGWLRSQDCNFRIESAWYWNPGEAIALQLTVPDKHRLLFAPHT